MKKIEICRALQIVDLPGGAIQIRSPGEHVTISRNVDLVKSMFKLTETPMEEESLADELAELHKVSKEVALNLVATFEKRGFLTNMAANITDPLVSQIAYFAGYEQPLYKTEGTFAISKTRVHVQGLGKLYRNVSETLRNLGFTVSLEPVSGDLDPTFDIQVYCSDFEDHEYFLEQNLVSFNNKSPTLYCSLNNSRGIVGPFVIPKQSGCFNCYHHRLRSNRQHTMEFDAYMSFNRKMNVDRKEVHTHCPVYAQVTAGMVATEILKFSVGLLSKSLIGKVLEINLIDYQVTLSPVLKLPRCTVCGGIKGAKDPIRAVRDHL